MIVVQLAGGLGNQLFQYATGRRLAQKQGTTLKVDPARLLALGDRRYRLDCLRTRARVARPWEVRPITGATQSHGWRRRVWHLANLRRGRVYSEPHFQFDPRVLELDGTVYLAGYWQSERYFADIVSLLRSELELRHPPSAASLRLASAMAVVASVSVHFRRGDYVANPVVNQVHGDCSLGYYHAAIQALATTEERPHFFVFSDDMAWAKRQFATHLPVTFVDHNRDREHEDLWLMRQCRHHIIANSSFSWWGAWLAEHPAKRVFAPKRWFRDPSINVADLLPAAWHPIDVQ